MIKSLYPPFQKWTEKGTLWIYSDPHFGDKDLAKIYLHDEEQIKRINSKVGKCDTLIILGDIGDIECAKKLKGYKVLICGNHDKGFTNYEEAFDEIYRGPLMISEKIILSHEPLDIDWALNIHGHKHNHYICNQYHLNCCANQINFTPINFNQLIKSGCTSKITSIHRDTINTATLRKHKQN